MNGALQGQVALVTGAASGIGLATAKAFAEACASVVLADVDEDAVRSIADELTSADHKAIAGCTDGRADRSGLWAAGCGL